MTQQELIETLIISDISDNITEEEKSCLELILAESEDARALYKEIERLLKSEEAQRMINAPSGEPPFKRRTLIIRLYNRYRVAGLSIAAMSIIIMGYFIIKQSVNIRSNTLSFNKDSLQLMLSSGEIVNLSGYDTIDVSGSMRQTVHTYLLDANKYKKQWATLYVPAGKFHHVVLPGGTKMLAYSATTIRFPVSFKKSREIYVDGKVYIDVPPDAGNPFSVYSTNSIIQVLGTQFSVSNYDKKDQVSLISGRVKVSTKKETKELKPGETTSIQPDYSQKISPFNDQYMLSGVYQNDRITLKEIGNFIHENYKVNVKVDEQFENKRFSVVIECHKPVEEFLDRLQMVTTLENGIVITK
jgi:ferric-dicitrate binding protein FerR (iron transport regulator)